MKICLPRFNIILLALFCIGFLSGCQTTKKDPEQEAIRKKYKKDEALVQLHLSGAPNTVGRTIQFRDKKINLSIEANPFLTWHHIVDAALLKDDSGYAIQLQFNNHGAFVLDTVTTAHRGRSIAIAVTERGKEQRWIAAPLIHQRNNSGVITFTPDATLEEAERIVYGIKNVAAQIRRQEQF